jgi:hypothetical protein
MARGGRWRTSARVGSRTIIASISLPRSGARAAHLLGAAALGLRQARDSCLRACTSQPRLLEANMLLCLMDGIAAADACTLHRSWRAGRDAAASDGCLVPAVPAAAALPRRWDLSMVPALLLGSRGGGGSLKLGEN